MIEWLNEHLGYVQGPVNIGIIKTDKGTIFIDTGIDNSSVNKLIRELGSKPVAAVITHHHADHMGGIAKLNMLGIEDIFVPGKELPMFTDTILEPLIFCGFYPPKTLRNKYLMARPARSIKTLSNLNDDKIIPISTPGHSLDHHSYLFEDVCFTGDAVFKQETIEKHQILFATNPNHAKQSVEKIATLNINMLLMGHGGHVSGRKEINHVLEINIDHYTKTKDQILETIPEKGAELHEIVGVAFKDLSLKKETITQYVLHKHTILGYLSNLIADKKLYFDKAKVVPS